MNIQQRIDELFDKYISGECSPREWEELMILVSGIKEEDTETLTAPLQRLWEQAGKGTLPVTPPILNSEQLYAAIMRQDADKPALPTETPVRRINWGRMMAAALLAGVIVTAGILLFVKNRRQQPGLAVVLPEQVKPGTSKATLTLASGQHIVLDSAATGVISQQGNIRVINFNGRLAYERTGKPNGIVAYNTVATGRANQYQLDLPDGSKVWLNAASSVRFPAAFNGNDRTVEMTGEAYFEVAPDPARPFYVKTRNAAIEVLGTNFNINAYSDEEVVKTSLLEGAVRVTSKDKTGVLQPGQEASVPAAGQLTIARGDVTLAVAWKSGYFQFDKAPLPVIMRQIGRWYDLDIKYAGAIPDKQFKGKIQRSLPLSGILSLLQQDDIHFKLEGRVLTVME